MLATEATIGERELAALPLDSLEEELSELASHLYAGTCRWLELVAEFDRREGWVPSGCRSCADWISWRCAVAPRAAREQVRVARRLSELPCIHAAFSRGQLSYSKVRALARVADERSEAELLELAQVLTAAQLERAVRAYRRVTSEEARNSHEAEDVSYFWDEDGSLVLSARLPAEDGALLLRALEAARDSIRARRHDEEGGSAEPPSPGPTPSNVEALVAMADLALAGESGARSGGERCQVVVHVDAAVLRDDADGVCELDDGVAVSLETARRLACDASLVPITELDATTLSVGRRTRTIPPSTRRALRARDRGCRFPGCENRRFVDAHHVEHWAKGGATRLDNLLLLCRRHHRLVHEGGYAVERLLDGQLCFRDPDGVAIAAVPRPPPADAEGLLQGNCSSGLAIEANTLLHGSGERMDLGLVVDALLQIAAGRVGNG